jgi:hypothetical protein
VPCSQKPPEHKRKNAAVLVVVDLDRRVDAQRHRQLLAAAIGARHHQLRVASRSQQRIGNHVDQLVALQAQRLPGVAPLELQGQNAHADQVAAVDALEALGDHGLDAQQLRTLGRPVAR